MFDEIITLKWDNIQTNTKINYIARCMHIGWIDAYNMKQLYTFKYIKLVIKRDILSYANYSVTLLDCKIGIKSDCNDLSFERTGNYISCMPKNISTPYIGYNVSERKQGTWSIFSLINVYNVEYI